MKAIFLVKNGPADKAFELRETPLPEIGPNEVLVKTECFGLNFADVVARRGMYPDAPPKPCILGYDLAGEVTKIGEKVAHLQIGDRVAAMSRFGGYAEFVKCQAAGVCKIPSEVSNAEATALATQGSTAIFCMTEAVRLHPGDTVLIHAAAGGVGSIMCQWAKHKGCKIVGTASKSKHEYLKSLGVDLCVDYHTEDFSKKVEAAFGKRSIDFVFDSIGGKTFKKGMSLLRAGGKIITFGAAAQMKGNKTGALRSIPVVFGFGLFSPLKLLMHSQAIIGVNMLRIADHKPHLLQKVFSHAMDLIAEGKLKINVAEEFDKGQIAEAHALLESGKTIGKIVVNW